MAQQATGRPWTQPPLKPLSTPAATLLGRTNIEHYAGYPRDGRTLHALLRIENATRVRITGGSSIDGQGPAFWDSPESPREKGP
jgi:hypothetical protein